MQDERGGVGERGRVSKHSRSESSNYLAGIAWLARLYGWMTSDCWECMAC